MPLKSRKQKALEEEAARKKAAEEAAEKAERDKMDKLTLTAKMLKEQIGMQTQKIQALQRDIVQKKQQAQDAVNHENRARAKIYLMQAKDLERQVTNTTSILTALNANLNNTTRAMTLMQNAKAITSSADVIKQANVEGLSEQVQEAQMAMAETASYLDGAFASMDMMVQDGEDYDAELDRMEAQHADEKAQAITLPKDDLDVELDSLASAPTPEEQRAKAKADARKKVMEML